MADAKITALSAMTLPVTTDVVPIVDDPGGTPATQKIAVLDLCGYSAIVADAGFTTTSTSLVNITGLSIPLTAGTWAFEASILASAATGTAGARLGVQYSGTTTSVNAGFQGQTNTTTSAATARITALNTGSTIICTTSAAITQNYIWGQIIVTGSGNLTIQGLKVTSGTLTVYGASKMNVRRIA